MSCLRPGSGFSSLLAGNASSDLLDDEMNQEVPVSETFNLLRVSGGSTHSLGGLSAHSGRSSSRSLAASCSQLLLQVGAVYCNFLRVF